MIEVINPRLVAQIALMPTNRKVINDTDLSKRTHNYRSIVAKSHLKARIVTKF